MRVPQTVMGSFYRASGDKLAVLGNLDWQNWERFGKVGVQVDSNNPSSLTVDRRYKDTWHGALGAQLQLSAPWHVSAGVAYDTTPVEDADRTPDLPLGAVWRIGAGAQHPLNERMTLGFAYELSWGGTMPMDVNRGLAGRVAGDYQDTSLHFFAVNLGWTF